ncbi:MAG TPA: methyltransferase domain-containing protein [Actinomycetales bacterium]|nr:methyltransferase domain-containing protein [Actinomycetales bacterium]
MAKTWWALKTMDPSAAVYTHGHHPSVLASHRNRTIANSAAYAESYFVPGARVLDIGSGPGTITAEIASRIAPGELVAVEINATAARLTAAELAQRQVTNARVVVGDVHNLGFANGAFDVVHAHQVLQHVADPVTALREMGRVARAGGVVAARDSDYGRFDWYPRLPELDEWVRLYQEAARVNRGEPDAGRYLERWAREAGFARIEGSASAWEYTSAESRKWWGEMWAARILESDLARQLLAQGRATEAELAQISAAWKRWADDPAAWFVIQHNEILITA